MWQQKTTPWDAAEIQPAFREIVEERWGEVEGVDWESLVDGGKGKALVPGCGRVCFRPSGAETGGRDLTV